MWIPQQSQWKWDARNVISVIKTKLIPKTLKIVFSNEKNGSAGERSSGTFFNYRGIHADAIVYIFAHSHTALLTEINMLGRNYLQAAKEPVKLHTC